MNAQQAALVAAALTQNLQYGYWSTVRCQFTRSTIAAGPPAHYRWTLSAGTRSAFQYGFGQSGVVAGFDSGYQTSKADTNIQTPGQTLANQTVKIYGLAIRMTEDSDPLLASLVARNMWIELSTDGQTPRPIGKITDFPGSGGFKGYGTTFLRAPADNVAGPGANAGEGGMGAQIGFVQNGEPAAGNYRHWHDNPVTWFPQSQPNAKDNNLAVNFILQNAVTVDSFDRAAVAGAAPGASGQVESFTSPSATPGVLGSYCDFEVMLITKTKGPLSQN